MVQIFGHTQLIYVDMVNIPLIYMGLIHLRWLIYPDFQPIKTKRTKLPRSWAKNVFDVCLNCTGCLVGVQAVHGRRRRVFLVIQIIDEKLEVMGFCVFS